MKKQNILGITVLLLAALLCCSALLAPTVAKYVSRVDAPFGASKSIDYTVNGVFEVKTQAELFAAINQGYTFIQLDPNIENPLIITQQAEDLETDLILDLNGIEIQRNGHDPILNVGKGVRLTIADTSAAQTGGLYNPVGSVFKIEEGGTLSVVTGVFESGPRYSEYYSYHQNVLAHNDYTARMQVEDYAEAVVLTDKAGNKTQCLAPIVSPYPAAAGDTAYSYGNLYFDETVTRSPAAPSSLDVLTITADTYCYYKSGEDTSDLNRAKDADFTYSYFVDKETHTYQKATLAAGDDPAQFLEITIYGYTDVIANAAAKTAVADYYAAIQMTGGTLDVQKGAFFTYFGVNTTACVNAAGGEIKIAAGVFSARVPDAKRTQADDVIRRDEREDDTAAFGADYFIDFTWTNDSFTAGAQARRGEGYGILNSGNAVVSIGTGDFYASNNNIIHMSEGTLSIGGGTFTKRSNGIAAPTSHTDADAAILMRAGMLTVRQASYTVLGDYTRAVYMQNGTLAIVSSDFSVTGDHTRAIHTENGSLTVTDTACAVAGDRACGIYSALSGSVTMRGGSITLTGSTCYGIYVEGGQIGTENSVISLSGSASAGIYSAGGTVAVTGGSVTLESNDNCYGIYAASTDAAKRFSVTVSGAEINAGYAVTTAKRINACNATVGVFLASANPANAVTLTNATVYSHEIGVALSGGRLDIAGTGEIKTRYASAIAVSGGNLTLAAGSDYKIVSANTTTRAAQNTYELYWQRSENGVLTTALYPNTDGIYVEGGSLVLEGTIDLTHTGLQNAVNYTNYTGLVVTSYAIRVEGGAVTVLAGSITANAGGGIYCSKGSAATSSITMGKEGGSNAITVTTLGTRKESTPYNAIGTYISSGWQSYRSITGGHAIELNGGDITVWGGTYEARYGNGVAANGSGTINIYSGTFYGFMDNVTKKSGPSAFYGLKVIGGATVNIYDGTFNGGNGGAFVTGIDTFNSRTDIRGSMAYVRVYAGTFGGSSTVDAFNVYDMATVVFGAHPAGTYGSAAEYNGKITMNGTSATIAANSITNQGGDAEDSYIYIYYGNYTGDSSNGIFNADGIADIYAYNIATGHTTVKGAYTDRGRGFYE